MRLYRESLRITVKLVLDYFWGQTNVTTFYVGLNIVVEGWLRLFSDQKILSLLDTKITAQRIIVITVNQLCSNGFGYKQ